MTITIKMNCKGCPRYQAFDESGAFVGQLYVSQADSPESVAAQMFGNVESQTVDADGSIVAVVAQVNN